MFFDNPDKLLKGITNIIGKLTIPDSNETGEPYCNIYDYIDKYIIYIELPGYDKENISIDITNDILIIKADNSNIKKDYKDCILNEIKRPHNPKKIILPSTVLDSIPIVRYESGILRLEFIKVVKATKNISIN